jgi:hypothetical protein
MLPQVERASFLLLSMLLLPRAKSASAAHRSGGAGLGGSLELSRNLMYKSGSALNFDDVLAARHALSVGLVFLPQGRQAAGHNLDARREEKCSFEGTPSPKVG